MSIGRGAGAGHAGTDGGRSGRRGSAAPPGGSDTVEVMVDGRVLRVPASATVAVALLQVGHTRFRTAIAGGPRAPLCGMGVCFECRVTIDGVTGVRACLVRCGQGMVIETGAVVHG